MPLTVNCSRCGHPLLPLTEDEEKLFLSGGTTIAQHPPGQCPHEVAARAATEVSTAPVLRHFEARVQIVEVNADAQSQDVLVDFIARASAPSAVAATAAGGPLPDALGEQWMRATERIGMADIPLAPTLASNDRPVIEVKDGQS